MSYSPVPRDERLSWRESFTVSGAALTNAPWGIALIGGAVVGGGNFLLNLTSFPLFSSILTGLWWVLAIAAVGAVWRRRSTNRSIRWARQHPFRFALLPAVITGVITIPLTLFSAGPFGAIGLAILYGVGTWVLVGLASMIARAARKD